MVNAMQQEVDHQELGMIRQIIVDMKQEPMEPVFEQRPDEIAKDEAQDGFEIRLSGKGEDKAEREAWVNFERWQMDATELKGRAQADVCRYGQPNRRHHPPLRPGKYLTNSQQNV